MQAVGWVLGYIGKQDKFLWNSLWGRRKTITSQLYSVLSAMMGVSTCAIGWSMGWRWANVE